LWAFFASAAPCSPTYQEGYDEMVYKYAHGAKIARYTSPNRKSPLSNWHFKSS